VLGARQPSHHMAVSAGALWLTVELHHTYPLQTPNGLRIINPQPMWNPQITGSWMWQWTVIDNRNCGFRTGISASPAGRAETGDDGVILRTRSP
jgi:hypothetical protein